MSAILMLKIIFTSHSLRYLVEFGSIKSTMYLAAKVGVLNHNVNF